MQHGANSTTAPATAAASTEPPYTTPPPLIAVASGRSAPVGSPAAGACHPRLGAVPAELVDETAQLARVCPIERHELGPGGRHERCGQARVGRHDHMRGVRAAQLLQRLDLARVKAGAVLDHDHAVLQVVDLD